MIQEDHALNWLVERSSALVGCPSQLLRPKRHWILNEHLGHHLLAKISNDPVERHLRPIVGVPATCPFKRGADDFR